MPHTKLIDMLGFDPSRLPVEVDWPTGFPIAYGAVQLGTAEVCILQLSVGKTRPFEVGVVEERTLQLGTNEVRLL